MDKNIENQVNSLMDNFNEMQNEDKEFFINNNCDKFPYPFIAFTGYTNYPKIFIVHTGNSVVIEMHIDSTVVTVIDYLLTQRLHIVYDKQSKLLIFKDIINREYEEFGYSDKLGWIHYSDLEERNY